MTHEQESIANEREKLFHVVYDILLEMIDFDDDLLGMAAREIVDAVAEHADEVQKIAAAVPKSGEIAKDRPDFGEE